jgi:hypothetical protein
MEGGPNMRLQETALSGDGLHTLCSWPNISRMAKSRRQMGGACSAHGMAWHES